MTLFKWLLVAGSALLIPAHADDGTGLGSQLTARINQSLGTPVSTDLIKVFRGQNGDPVFSAVSSLPSSGGASLSTPNTWTAVQTFTNSDIKLLGSSTGGTTFTSANSGASNFTVTVPAATGTIALLGAQTFTGAQTFGEVLGAVTTQSGTTYTFAATDCGTEVVFSNAGAITATIPATLPVGCNISILQTGAGKVSVNGTAVAAATLNTHVASSAATGTAGQWAIIGVNIYSNAGGSSAIAVLTGDGS